MQTRALGRSELQVPVICFGCWAIAGDAIWGPQDERAAIRAMHEAADNGLSFFDSAEGYGAGDSEALLGRGLHDRRDRVIIATKASPSNHAPAALKQACEDSLRRLQTDYIDLYQLHWPSREVGFEETWAAMEELIVEGKVRAGGVSNFGPLDLEEMLEHGRPATDQVAYSLLFRAPEYEIAPMCGEEGISILCYSSIMQGLLADKYATPDEVPDGRARSRHFSGDRPQARHGEAGAEELTFDTIAEIRRIARELGEPMHRVAIAWLIEQPAVGSVIVGIRSPEQARDNLAAGDLKLGEEILRRLDEATQPLKERLGTNADMWQGKSRIR